MLSHDRRFQELRDTDPSREIYNIAADCGINHVLEGAGFTFSPEDRPVRFSDFKSIDETMSTEQVYFILKDEPKGSSSTQTEQDPDGPETSPGKDSQKSEAESPEQGHDCGSVSGGSAREYELASDDPKAPGSSQETQVVVISQVAAQVAEAARSRGNVPAGLLRWADDWLNPQVNWRRQLAVRVRTSLATKTGRRDYSMMRPSRREQGLSKGDVQLRLPSMRQPANPKTKVVVDTSGSISADQLKEALGEVMGILKAVGNSAGLYIIPCDSVAYPSQLVRSSDDLKRLKFPGGGGTDMGAGLAAAVNDKPKPDIVIVITDGFTPWPTEKPRGCDNFIVVVNNEQGIRGVPLWAKPILAEDLN
jgi:predicted metal-dependent peptidase